MTEQEFDQLLKEAGTLAIEKMEKDTVAQLSAFSTTSTISDKIQIQKILETI